MKRAALIVLLLTACSAPSPVRHERHAACNAAAVVAQYAADLATLRAANAAPVRASLDEGARAVNRAADAARNELAAMRQTPSAQGPDPRRATLQAFANALDRRFARAHAYLEQQAREKESSAALDFDRSHLRERLAVDVRLRDGIYLQRRTAQALRARLAQLDTARRTAVAQQRALDERWIAGEDARLRGQFAGELNALVSDLPAPHAAARSLPDHSRATSEALRGAADDLAARYAQLGRIDSAARADIGAEIAALAKERQALRERCSQQGSAAVARK